MILSRSANGKEIGKLPDEGDRHVIAAAIKTKADIIVTENLKDFPRKVLAQYGIEAKSSDDFIADAINLNPTLATDAIKRMRARLDRPDKTPEIWLLDMEMTGLDPDGDVVIEIASIVTDSRLNTLAEGPVIAFLNKTANLDEFADKLPRRVNKHAFDRSSSNVESCKIVFHVGAFINPFTHMHNSTIIV